MLCWFCDHVQFDASQDGSHFPGDLRLSFEKRMAHIREHIVADYETPIRMRPDFYMVNHLFQHGLLNEEDYRAALEFSEVPASMYLNLGQAYGTFGEPSTRTAVSEDCTQRIVHDLEKEDRYRRRGLRVPQPRYWAAEASAPDDEIMYQDSFSEASPSSSSVSSERSTTSMLTSLDINRKVTETTDMTSITVPVRTRAARGQNNTKFKSVPVVTYGSAPETNQNDYGWEVSPRSHFWTIGGSGADDRQIGIMEEMESLGDPAHRNGSAANLKEAEPSISAPSRTPSPTSEVQPLGWKSLDSELFSDSDDAWSGPELINSQHPVDETLITAAANRLLTNFYAGRSNGSFCSP